MQTDERMAEWEKRVERRGAEEEIPRAKRSSLQTFAERRAATGGTGMDIHMAGQGSYFSFLSCVALSVNRRPIPSKFDA